MQFSGNCTNLIAKFEGFSAKPYYDPGTGGEPITIGYGTTVYPNGAKVTMKDSPVSIPKAQEMLLAHLNKIVLPILNANLKVNLKQNQIDALGCLIYNIGGGAFEKSTLLKGINNNASLSAIETSWKAWNKGGGKVLPGLVKRREAEFNLYKA